MPIIHPVVIVTRVNKSGLIFELTDTSDEDRKEKLENGFCDCDTANDC